MTRDRLILVLILLLVAGHYFVDYALPGVLLPAVLYALPLLIAAYGMPPRLVAGVVGCVAGSYLLAAWIRQSPLWEIGLREAGLLLLGYLAIAFSLKVRREGALKARAEALAEERTLAVGTLRALVDAIPAGVLISDASETITMANPAAGTLFPGMGPGSLCGRQEGYTLHRIDGSPYPRPELPLCRAIQKGQVTRNVEVLVRQEDGTEKVVMASAAPTRNALGCVTGAVAVFQDISLHWLAEAMLQTELETRRELENVVNRSPAIAFLWRASEGWPVEFVSENVTQFGYSTDDLVSGRVSYAEVVHPEDLERVAAEVSRYCRDGVADFTQEYRVLTRSGEVRWVDDRSWVRRDPKGKITHFQGIVLDITDRRRAEAERERLTAILEATPDFVGIADGSGRLLYLNRAARRMLGIGEEQTLANRGVQDNHPEWATELILHQAFPTAIRDGLWEGEAAVLRDDGRETPISMVIVAHHGPDGTVEYLSTISRDISERKRLEAEREWLRTVEEQLDTSGLSRSL